jgi:hypothetical protein
VFDVFKTVNGQHWLLTSAVKYDNVSHLMKLLPVQRFRLPVTLFGLFQPRQAHGFIFYFGIKPRKSIIVFFIDFLGKIYFPQENPPARRKKVLILLCLIAFIVSAGGMFLAKEVFNRTAHHLAAQALQLPKSGK